MTWSGKLTCNLGVGVGELAADDDLIRLRPVKVTAGLVALAEEVADEALGGLIQILEVGGDLGVGISVEMRRWLDADLKCSIGEKEKRLTRGEDGAAEERRKNLRRHACCWPFVRSEKERLGFLGEFEEGKSKESSARWRNYSADGVIYSLEEGR